MLGPSESITLTKSNGRVCVRVCTNLSLGSLVQLRPSFDPNDWRANENSDEWNDLTIKVYGSEANDVISDGGGFYNFNPQGWVIATGQGDDSVTLTNYKGYYSGRDSVGLGAVMTLAFYGIGRN